MSVSGREAALQALSACRKRGAWSEDALSSAIAKNGLDSREAALASRICYGVVQNRMLCDYYLRHVVSTPLEKLEPLVLDILRMGVYQIALMDKIPASAAVNESVKLAKAHGLQRAAGLINAVLRRLAKGPLPEITAADDLEALSIQTSHPLWLVRRIRERIGPEEAAAFFRENNRPAAMTAQVNTLKTDRSRLKAELTDSGVSCDEGYVDDCLILSHTGPLEQLPAFARGAFYVQDMAAVMAVSAAGMRPGMRVLDGCAAPGGKSFACAIAMENRGEILSCDIHENKLSRIQSGARRLGIGIIRTRCADARQNEPTYNEAFDAVLADVPCSGLGVIRKKPEIRYKDPETIKELPVVQSDILENLSRYVRPGGVLLYATCTVLPEENEEVLTRFLETHGAFKPEGFRLPGPAGDVPGGMITLWPQRHGTDGFFIGKLRRQA